MPNDGREPWPGRPERRDLSADVLRIGRNVLDAGLFRDRAHVRSVSAALLAGTPPRLPLDVRWHSSAEAGTVTLSANSMNTGDRVEIQRVFRRHAVAAWAAEHAWFVIPPAHRGGSGRRMMRASVEAYDDLGVVLIGVHANLDLGGYVWAKYGFVTDDAEHIRAMVREARAREPASELFRAASAVAGESEDDDLMFNLARLSVPEVLSAGKLLLAGGDWWGYADLTRARHRERIAENFRSDG